MPTDPDTDQLLFAFDRIAVVLRAAGWRTARDQSLTPTQAETLAHLVRRGPSRNAEIAAMLRITPATLSDAVAALVAKGHVTRQPDPEDARAQRLVPTTTGAEAARALREMPNALGGVLADLPAADRGALLRHLTQIIRALQEARAIPVQRMCANCVHFRPNMHEDAARPHHCAFVDAAFADTDLRLDCGEHEAAPAAEAAATWRRFQAA